MVKTNEVKRALFLMLLAVMPVVSLAKHQDVERPKEWEGLVDGGRFMDRFLPMPIWSERTNDTWGVDAVKPRDLTNGLEDPDYSYWGGNILKGDDGLYHMFVCRWPEDNERGHKMWSKSGVVRATSDNLHGPYKVAEAIGRGHNPEVFRLNDGRYVLYAINRRYVADKITGPWKHGRFQFDSRGRKVVEGLSNLSFAQRDDGSYLMVCRGGGIWISRDGLDVYEQVTQGSNYPPVPGRYEDPVLWKTEVQYHMIVNDWYGRIAYHLRSKDGIHWKVDPGEAYVPGIAMYEDGKVEDWYKFERIKVAQDEYGRAVQASFAVIDVVKSDDKGGDNHSSKNLLIPLVPGRRLTLLNETAPGADTKEIRVRIAAEKGFDPHKDIKEEGLRYGAPEVVDFGGGARLLRTEKEGTNLIAVFAAEGHGFEDHNFAGKLLGRTSENKLLFGYSRLPWVAYGQSVLSADGAVAVNRTEDGFAELAVSVKNYGLSPSTACEIRLDIQKGSPLKTVKTLKGNLPPVPSYETRTVKWTLPDDSGLPENGSPISGEIHIEHDGAVRVLKIGDTGKGGRK